MSAATILFPVLIAYTAVMFLIHVTSWALLRGWSAPGDSWLKRRFSAQTALRVEAVYWLLILASWSLWPFLAWKIVLAVFAVIHLGTWLAGERQAIRAGAAAVPPPPPKVRRFIVAFDSVEAVALIGIAWSVVLNIRRG